MLSEFKSLSTLRKFVILAGIGTMLIVGIFTGWVLYIHSQPSQISFNMPTSSQAYAAPIGSISGKPVKLRIASLNMDLPVIDGAYDPYTHNWTLTKDKAQFFVESAEPNNIAGKTFIYGHYRPEVFASLHNIQKGAILSIATNNGYKFNYQYFDSWATSPSDLSVLDNTKQPVLYVQTCSGFRFQNRQIFSFRYVGYERMKA